LIGNTLSAGMLLSGIGPSRTGDFRFLLPGIGKKISAGEIHRIREFFRSLK
jgi:hypothetical protein